MQPHTLLKRLFRLLSISKVHGTGMLICSHSSYDTYRSISAGIKRLFTPYLIYFYILPAFFTATFIGLSYVSAVIPATSTKLSATYTRKSATLVATNRT